MSDDKTQIIGMSGISMVLPGLTKEQMIEVDRIMVEDLSVPIELMMEHAGENLAHLTCKSFEQNEILVIAGPGNNGGGGLVAARRLCAWGHKVAVWIPMGTDALNHLSTVQLERALALDIELHTDFKKAWHDWEQLPTIDAYLGYGFSPRSHSITEKVLSFLRGRDHIISLDVPSGLDLSSGINTGGIEPAATLTIGFPKAAHLRLLHNSPGELYVCDIGIPQFIYLERLGIKWNSPYSKQTLATLYHLFSKSSLLSVFIETCEAQRGCWRPIE